MVLDEVHERSVNTDVLMAILKKVARERGESFKLVVMSATLDLDKFMNYFNATKVVKVEGRTHQIAIFNALQP